MRPEYWLFGVPISADFQPEYRIDERAVREADSIRVVLQHLLQQPPGLMLLVQLWLERHYSADFQPECRNGERAVRAADSVQVELQQR